MERQAIVSKIGEKALKYGIPQDLFTRMIGVESDFDPAAYNEESGASGLGQVIPSTQRAYGLTDPWDIDANLDVSAKILKENLDRRGGDEVLAVADYYKGPTFVNKFLKGEVPITEDTIAHLKKIFGGGKESQPYQVPPSKPLPEQFVPWGNIEQSEKYQGLDYEGKRKVKERYLSKYIEPSSRFQGLEDWQKSKVRDTFLNPPRISRKAAESETLEAPLLAPEDMVAFGMAGAYGGAKVAAEVGKSVLSGVGKGIVDSLVGYGLISTSEHAAEETVSKWTTNPWIIGIAKGLAGAGVPAGLGLFGAWRLGLKDPKRLDAKTLRDSHYAFMDEEPWPFSTEDLYREQSTSRPGYSREWDGSQWSEWKQDTGKTSWKDNWAGWTEEAEQFAKQFNNGRLNAMNEFIRRASTSDNERAAAFAAWERATGKRHSADNRPFEEPKFETEEETRDFREKTREYEEWVKGTNEAPNESVPVTSNVVRKPIPKPEEEIPTVETKQPTPQLEEPSRDFTLGRVTEEGVTRPVRVAPEEPQPKQTLLIEPETTTNIEEQTPSKPEILITEEPEGPTITSTIPEEKAEALPLKQQKAYLLKEIDVALKSAPKLEDITGKGKPDKVTIDVPGDGTFTLTNTKESLGLFKKSVDTKFPSTLPKPGLPKISSRTVPGKGKRIAQEDVTYYNEFQPRPANVKNLKPSKTTNGVTEDGYVTNDHMAVKVKTTPSGFADKIETKVSEFIKGANSPATIQGEYHNGYANEPPKVHVVGNGVDTSLNAEYVDIILGEHPKAKPFVEAGSGDSSPVVFKVGKDVVGMVMPMHGEGLTKFSDRIEELTGKKPVMDILKSEAGAVHLPSRDELKRTYNHFIEFWGSLSTLPQYHLYKEERYSSFGDLARVEQLQKRIGKLFKGLTDQEDEQAFHAMIGNVPSSNLSPRVKDIVRQMRRLNNLAGQMLVNRGLLKQETFDRLKDTYAHYVYFLHVFSEDVAREAWKGGKLDFSYLKKRTLTTDEQRRARGWIERLSTSMHIGIGKAFSDIFKFDHYQTIADHPVVTLPSGEQIGFSELKGRLNALDKYLRSSQGRMDRVAGRLRLEYLNVYNRNRNNAWVWPESTARFEGKTWGAGALQEELGEMERLKNHLPNVPEIDQRIQDIKDALASTRPPQDLNEWKLLKGKNWGPLNGVYVRYPVYRDLVPFLAAYNREGSGSQLVATASKINDLGMTAFKAGKVALNPPTMARNIGSNIIQLRFSGMQWHEIYGGLAKAIKEYASKSPKWKLALRNGIFKTNFTDAELSEILKQLEMSYQQGGKKVYSSIMHFAGKVTGFYGKIDDLFKLSKFMHELDKGKTPKQAAVEAQKWGMDYSLVHPAVRAARRSIMPMATYSYKIVPLILEALATRPWVFLEIGGLIALLGAAAMYSLDTTPEELKKTMSNLPKYIKETKSLFLMPWKSPEGNLQFADYGFWVPWGNISDLAEGVGEQNMAKSLRSAGIGNPYLDMLFSAYSTKTGGPPVDPFTGAPIYNRLDTSTMKMAKLTEWVTQRFMPSFISSKGPIGKMASIGEKDKYGRTITWPQAAGSMVGWNIFAPTQLQGLIGKKAEIRTLKSERIRMGIDLLHQINEAKKQGNIPKANKLQKELNDLQNRFMDETRKVREGQF